ncbi:MAG: UTP--glucose-1-phosphate uridylyltransferase, partial [Sphingomicrobium sp.]
DEPFAVLLADDLILAQTSCLKQMVDAHTKAGGNMIAVMDVPRTHVSRYGILQPGRDDGRLVEVKGLVEKPTADKAPSTLAVIGRYLLEPKVFEHLERQNRGAGGEIQLTDALATLIGRSAFHGLRFEGKRFDCGDKVGFFEANLAFALARDDIGADVRDIVKNYV